MTEDQCNTCRYAGHIAYDDGDMFCCEKDDDPNMPFDMDENTYCPCFEKDDDCSERKLLKDIDYFHMNVKKNKEVCE